MKILLNGDLKVTDITEGDDDIYTCSATNFVGPMDTKAARLTVIVPVSVSVSPRNATVYPGEDVEITCVSSGKPKPTVEWYKNNNLLSSQGRVTVSSRAVIISQVETSDSGYYKCQSSHNYGEDSDRMYLNVIKKRSENII